MHALRLRVRVWIRARWRQLAVTALVIGLAGGLTIVLGAGTRRTDSAPDRATEIAGGDPDLVIQQQSGPPLTDSIADLDGVTSARSSTFVTSFIVSPIDGALVVEPNPFAGDDRILGARVVEGRFTEPDAPDEFTVNRPFAEILRARFRAEIGSRFEIASFDQGQTAANAFDSGEAPAVPPFMATLVGITETPSEFDDPSPQMVFASSFLAAHPTVGVVQTVIVVELAPGADPSSVLNEVRGLANGEDVIAVPRQVVSADARRAVRFQVNALWIVTALVALAAAVVVAQVGTRLLRVDDDEFRSLDAIGWRRAHLVTERSVEGVVAALVAAPISLLIGLALSPLFPFGALRILEPDTGLRGDGLVSIVCVLGMVLVMVIAAAIATRRPRAAPAEDRAGVVARAIAVTGAGLVMSIGARMSATSRHGRAQARHLIAGAIGVAGIVGSSVVWLSLATITDDPPRWGVNYDQLFGNPYVPTDADIVGPTIEDPDLTAVSAANIGALTINGHDVATFAFEPARGSLRPVTIEGRSPLHEGEIGLGAEVARRLQVKLGDDVDAEGTTGDVRRLRVVGLVVTPDSAGNGAAMTFADYQSLSPSATKNVLLVKFREGASVDAANEIADANYSPPGALLKPTSVRALQRVTAAPFVLGVVLCVLMAVAGAYLLTASVRAHQGDLAVLRAIGTDRRQLRAIVHWQSTFVALVALLFGLPVGIVLGRLVIDSLTGAIGIVPGSSVPPLVMAGVALTTLAVANLLALVPATRAAQANVTRLTRDR